MFYSGDNNAESFNDLINQQVSQGGNMMLISEDYFRSKVSSGASPQALYEKRIQAADSEKLLWLSLKVALKYQGQVSTFYLRKEVLVNMLYVVKFCDWCL